MDMQELRATIKQLDPKQLDEIEAIIQEARLENSQSGNWALAIGQMAQADTDIEWNNQASNISENSREILHNEFADYLIKRQQRDDE